MKTLLLALMLALMLLPTTVMAQDYRTKTDRRPVQPPRVQIPVQTETLTRQRVVVETIDRPMHEKIATWNDLLDIAARISPKCERDVRYLIEQELFPKPEPKIIINPFYKAK